MWPQGHRAPVLELKGTVDRYWAIVHAARVGHVDIVCRHHQWARATTVVLGPMPSLVAMRIWCTCVSMECMRLRQGYVLDCISSHKDMYASASCEEHGAMTGLCS